MQQKKSWICSTFLRFIVIVEIVFYLPATLSDSIEEAARAQSDPSTIRIGILAFRTKEITRNRWHPLAAHLAASIPEYRFNIVAFNYPELETAVEEKRIHFILTNTGHYVKLELLYGIIRLVTLVTLVTLVKGVNHSTVKEFGGVIFTRADREDIHSLNDLKGLSLTAVKEDSLGGFMAAYSELLQQGIDPYNDLARLQFSGMPHDRVVSMVTNKQADAGVVRTSVLEQLASEGRIDLSDYKILNPRKNNSFPFVHSTTLYPEWPLSKLNHVHDALAKKVAIALLEQPMINRGGGNRGTFEWAVPLDYTPVHQLMKKLRLPPYDKPPPFNLLDVIRQYLEPLLVMAVLAFLVACFVFFKILRMNNALVRAVAKLEQSEINLARQKERAEVTLKSIGDAVITTDDNGILDFLNPVAERLTGWALQEACGQSLENVYTILNESTRQPVLNPVERCLAEGQIIGLGNHTILINRHGHEYAIQDSAAPIRNPAGVILGVVLVFSDVTEIRKIAQQLSYQATHDPLTDLINRREFEQRLKRVIEHSQTEHHEHTLCYLDLDQFKVVNDVCGHAAGDELLCKIGQLLQQNIRKRDTVARLGGDEFGVLMEHCSLEQALRVANALQKALAKFQFVFKEHIFNIGMSIGIVPISTETVSLTELFIHADTACYAAKEKGRNRIHVYHQEDAEISLRHGEMQWVSKIHRALKDNRFRLYLQPIVPVTKQNETGHYELLLRMENNDGELILPGMFMPAAERFSIAEKIDQWVIQSVFSWFNGHPEQLECLSLCAINLSGQSLGQEELLAFITRQLSDFNIPPTKFCFEITETVAIANIQTATHFIKKIKSLGCQSSLDDFGSGLSSFAYLKNLPVDYLKIDGAFIKNIVNDPIDLAMVKSINEIGHLTGKKTIAEWVENDPILEKLREVGVDYAQGYGVGMPQSIDKIFL